MKLDRFGWAQMADAMKDRLTLDWCDVLSPYRLEEVKAACAAIMARRPKDATNEKQVEVDILASRTKVLALSPEPVATYVPCPNRITPEAHAAMMAEYDFDGKVKVKSFNSKPEERE
jgi:hypothetical protein